MSKVASGSIPRPVQNMPTRAFGTRVALADRKFLAFEVVEIFDGASLGCFGGDYEVFHVLPQHGDGA